MDILKISVRYIGYYGGDVDEVMILPNEVNGVVFPKLEEGLYKDALHLGEIEGKHSDVYGDMLVEVVSLDSIRATKAKKLIESSYYEQFSSFFEDLEVDADDEGELDEGKVKELMLKYGVESPEEKYGPQSEHIHNAFIEDMKDNYIEDMVEIIIKKEDYNKIKEILVDNNIEILNNEDFN